MSKKHSIISKVYDRKGRQLAFGINSYTRSHPVQSYFSNMVGMPDRIYLHAEIQSLLRCKDKIPHTIVVERYNAAGEMALAAPCPICMQAIKAYGVKKIRYTTCNGWKEISV